MKPVLALVLSVVGSTCACFAQTPVGPVELFDGKTLNGWEADPDYWRVENGAIVGEIPADQFLQKNTWLVWCGGVLADFDLQAQFKLTGNEAANSGIQFRCQVESVDHVSGYQADLDMGATWLGRIYDEHGRALLAERGTRVLIEPDGARRVETRAPAGAFAVLFREDEWNDYRIVAIGDHVAVSINGTVFSELKDQQTDQRDLKGRLALQLHSGPATRVEFRKIRLERLEADDTRLGPFSPPPPPAAEAPSGDEGVAPISAQGVDLNMSFEAGTLAGWTATGDAFRGQPVKQDGIAKRWPGQTSNKRGDFFIGGYEIAGDGPTGTLTSPLLTVTHPYASFLIGGGDAPSTRVEILAASDDGAAEKVVYSATGRQQEQMRRVVADLRMLQGRRIAVRLVDESGGGWGHLNFDDFRFHQQPPAAVEPSAAWRSTQNPLLQHLVANPLAESERQRAGASTIAQMWTPPGFSVDVVAAEPDLHQPMAFAFDARGRLWVAEGYSYPQKRPDGEGLDRILILADEDGDGRFENRKIFIEGLNLVSGMEVGHGGVWIGAAPELLFIPDRDNDDQPDGEPQVLLDGFGYADTHETMNSFMWGPDGWLYGNQGVFNQSAVGAPGAPASERRRFQAGVWRFHPTRRVFEVFAYGGSNQWGLDYDEFGQIFMTHCRSYWGRGPTTQVIQGGHYWNQVNSGYAPFISAVGLPDRPAMRNYLLASARYGHGEGGAGKPGSREVYGGHSHVGTMIYLGDNWPETYRNHLFTHNLHGHQLNHQVNVREAGGYNTLHAGYDMLFSADPQYVAVDLQYGPDGAVYISDWYDPRHCHNPNVEHWDRGNGRMYRMKFDATYRPTLVDYAHATDEELVAAQLHRNDWHVRAARLELGRRAAEGRVSARVIPLLSILALDHPAEDRRLRGVWALHAVGGLDEYVVAELMQNGSEYVRGWAVQLAVEALDEGVVTELLTELVAREKSLLVRRYLASAIQRTPTELGWRLAEALSGQAENAADRDLPNLIWFGLAGLMEKDLTRGLQLADSSQLPALRDDALWYAARLSAAGRDAIATRLANTDPAQRLRSLSLFELAVRGMRGLPQPSGWEALASELYDAPDPQVRRLAESLGAAFGDDALYARMRKVLGDNTAGVKSWKHALSILASDSSPENLPHFLKLLDVAPLTAAAAPLLGQYHDASIPRELLARLPGWEGQESAAALEVLSSRAAWAGQLLDAVADSKLEKSRITAYYARQMSNLGDPQLNDRLAREWGAFGQSSAQLRAEIAETIADYESAPLWAYSDQAGAAHFKSLCAACHQPAHPDERIAPKLAGSGSKGVGYLVENVLDPNAVIGRDYQARIIQTEDGRVTSGLIEQETETAITVRTATNSVTIAKDQIEDVRISPNSFMPVGLLDKLSPRERIELLKYLMSL